MTSPMVATTGTMAILAQILMSSRKLISSSATGGRQQATPAPVPPKPLAPAIRIYINTDDATIKQPSRALSNTQL
ncbi:hypothetical protein amb1958 [Paramagnetospirillum magneticum AMB-1]|uniref:Uncharacterized protein n=1 Tax=Paramagnetospirillum magneticum (strain ATCC 700264 / AMB-1) TaxID=342108 RepID=Q2W5W3_PARM1|nr:hypothetical protein amb1958 [Paramagnetospirillum magneticum AMB-1]